MASHTPSGAVSPALTVLIEGPSGTGKSTLAAYLASRWPQGRQVHVLHMDDLYRGWDGLARASEMLYQEILKPRSLGRSSWVTFWSWTNDALGESVLIDKDVDLIVEGCGCLTGQTSALCDYSMWLNEETSVRKARALSRGGEDLDAHWDRWESQYEEFTRANDPAARASIKLRPKR